MLRQLLDFLRLPLDLLLVLRRLLQLLSDLADLFEQLLLSLLGLLQLLKGLLSLLLLQLLTLSILQAHHPLRLLTAFSSLRRGTCNYGGDSPAGTPTLGDAVTV